mmetsp:Transcript_28261/g.42737  ORF Transcript_28261/g.42737 Transcript_28261/m.42737 type:complete len:252 (-) Transcript_28261:117-872(-)
MIASLLGDRMTKEDVLLIGLALFFLFRFLRDKLHSVENLVKDAETIERERILNEEMNHIRLQQQDRAAVEAVEAEKIRQAKLSHEQQRKAEAVMHKHLRGGKRLGGTGLFQGKGKKEEILKKIRLQQQEEANRLSYSSEVEIVHQSTRNDKEEQEKTATITNTTLRQRSREQPHRPRTPSSANNIHTLMDYPGQSTAVSSSGNGNWNSQGTRFMTADDRWAQSERGARLRKRGNAPPPPGQAPSSRGNWGR